MFEMTVHMRTRTDNGGRERAVLCWPRLLSVGSGSDQGGLVVLCLWDWLPVIVNLSPYSVMDV